MTTPVLSAAGIHTPATIARLAVDALLAEARLTPKPGLVDLRGPGVHTDMTVELLVASAHALSSAFARLAATAADCDAVEDGYEAMAEISREGEHTMLAATGGVNTHRGALWALGLNVAAAASGCDLDPRVITATAARIAACHEPRTAHRPGARARERYGVGGALGQARCGFPQALAAIEAMRRTRASGGTENSARLDALLTAMSTLDDTCLLARGGLEALHTAQQLAASALEAGGAGTHAGYQILMRLDQELHALGVSPGGSADMTALAIFLDILCPTPPREPSCSA
ncbi:triphosphoribosyl-dephospho-CoA synthase [Streptomyces sp. NPDC055037]